MNMGKHFAISGRYAEKHFAISDIGGKMSGDEAAMLHPHSFFWTIV